MINDKEKLISDLEYQESFLMKGISERKQKIKIIRKQLSDLRGNTKIHWMEKSIEMPANNQRNEYL